MSKSFSIDSNRGLEAVEFGRLQPKQALNLRRADNYFSLVNKPSEIASGPKSHPATALAPTLLQLIEIYLHSMQALDGIDPGVSLVVAYSNRTTESPPVNASARRTDDFLSWPKSYLIRIQIDCVSEIFKCLKSFLADGQLLKTLQKMGLPDLQKTHSIAELFSKGLFGSLMFLFLHELAHVTRDHLSCLASLSLDESLSITNQATTAAGARRIVECDADMIGSMSLAHMLPVLCPSNESSEAANAEYWFAWSLLHTFVLFTALAQSSPVGDANQPESERWYYSPLVRCHVLPLALGASLKISAKRSDDLLARFYDALDSTKPDAPVLANYSRWQSTFDEDLAHWRKTEVERVSWQSQGRFNSLFGPSTATISRPS